MNFAYPEFLFALAAISVPIIIHLFNFRRFKKVYFSDIRFLKDVEVETKSRNQLKNLLILLSRILAITFLVMAFARPVIPTTTENTVESTAAVVYLDNSFSMNAVGENGNLLEESKAKAIEVASALSNGMKVRLLTNDFKPEHFRDLSFEEFKNEVSAVQPSPIVRSLDQIISRSSGMYDAGEAVAVYYISDLQASSSTPIEENADSLLSIYSIPATAEVESNIYIDSCWFDSPTRLPLQPDEIRVRVRNAGTANLENVSVKLDLNGVQRAVATTDLAANTYEDVTLAFTNPDSGLQLGKISIEDYPITYDDNYLFSYDLAQTISVLCIQGSEPTSHFKRLFDSELNVNYTEVPASVFDYSLLTSTDLLVLNEVKSFSSGMIQEVMKFANEGGHVLFVANQNQDLESTQELLLALNAERISKADSSDQKAEGVNLESALFKNVFTEWEDRIDLPVVKKFYSTESRTNSSAERLLTLSNGQPLLTTYRSEEGYVYVIPVSLRDDWTNLHRHALFVPAIYNIAINSINSAVSMESIGSNNLIRTNTSIQNSEILRVNGVENDLTFVPEIVRHSSGTGIYVHDQVAKGGHYLLTTEPGDTIQTISFNYDRSESDLKTIDATEFISQLKEKGFQNAQILDGAAEALANKVKETKDGKHLWRLFLILALGCLLIETILIRIL